MQRWWLAAVVLVAFVAALVGAPPAPVAAATRVVNSTSDNGTTCGMTGVLCLREAISSASDGDTITFDPAVFAGAQTITLGRSTVNVNAAVTILGPQTGALTVAQTGGSDAFQITAQSGAQPVVVANITVTGGNSAFAVRAGRTLTVANSTLSGNRNNGIYIDSGGTVTVTNSTLSGNDRGIFNNGGTATVTNSTLSGNGTVGIFNNFGTATVTNTIIAGNSGRDVANTGTLTDGGNNLVGDGSLSGGTGDKTGDPLLGPLQNNGGPTPTQAITSSSPAYGAGNLATCQGTVSTGPDGTTYTGATATDQRGASRVVGGACSIGAFEPGVVTSVTTLTANPATSSFGQSVTLTASVAGVLGGMSANDGTVAFKDGTTTLTGCTSQPVNMSGVATCTTSGLAGGMRALTASYTPGTNYTASTSTALPFTVSTVACVVTSTADTVSGSGVATLRDAVNTANAGGCTSNTITFSATFATAQTITLASTLTISNNVTIDATVGNRAVTITTAANSGVRLFAVNSGVTLGLSGLTLTGGNTTGSGGAITSAGGTVNITGSTLSGNRSGNSGGAIFTTNNGTVTLTGSTLSGNTAPNAGGGAIFNLQGTPTITGSTLSGNTAGDGGAIFNSGGTANITGSTLSSNSTPDGSSGAILNNQGTLTLTNSTLSGNSARNGSGGAIDNNSTLTLTGSTLSGNTARDGGAIYNAGGTVTITLSVVAGNTASSSGPDIRGTITTDDGGNVVGTTADSSGLINGTDRLNVPALLGPLANNGGTVRTQALLPGSPAIDIAACPIDPITNATIATDARSVSRPQGANCDAGAYEARAFTVSALTGNNQSATVNTAFGSAVGLTVAGTMGDPVAGGQITFTITAGGTGASAAFTGTAPAGCTKTSATVFVCTIPAGGVVTSPAFTANGTVGGFTVVATASGLPPSTFTETNTGTAPTAANDGPYTVTTGTTLTVSAATGVLANDTLGNPAATLAVKTQPAHGMVALNTTDGSFTYTPAMNYVGSDSFTYTLTNSVGTSTGTVNLTVTAATVTGLTTTAPTGSGSGNTGTASAPTLNVGGRLTLSTTASYNNGTTGTASPLSYTSSTPGVASVDPVSGVVTANTAGTTIITVTGPNGSRTMLTITVTGAAGTGLMPAPQPMTHADAPLASATPLPQPTAHPVGNGSGSGVQPHVGSAPTATPIVQPGRH